MNNTPAVIVNIQRQPGANIIQVVDRVKKLLPQLKANLPASMDVSILTDRTTTIRASVRDVQFSLMLTIALVVLAIFLFLRSVRATIIPELRRAALARRHFGRHVSARLQPEQSYADGADDFHRLRGGRRHRDDRKCFSLHRAGRKTAASRVERRGTNRLHDYFADDFADRRADSAACSWATLSAGCSANLP